MIELNIRADGSADLAGAIAALHAQFCALSPPAEAPTAKADKPKPVAKKDEPKTPPTQEAEPIAKTEEPVAEVAKEAPASEGEQAVAYADVQKAVTALALAKGRDAVLGVFGQFDVDHGSKLTEEQWPAALAALQEAAK
jgi:hypothetical protein